MIVLLAALWLSPPQTGEEALPRPNGYDDLVAAGKMLPASASDWNDLNPVQLRATLATNRAALDLALRGLSKKCQVPMEYTGSYFDAHSPDIAQMRALGKALEAEGKLAEADAKQGDAARDYATVVELGVESGRGGVLIHRLVEIAIESIGEVKLKALTPKLSAKECRECLTILEKARADRDSFNSVARRERRYSRRVGPLRQRLLEFALSCIGRDTITKLNNLIRGEDATALKALLTTEGALAARDFELASGRKPKTWGDLVPAYLDKVPDAPETNGPMAFTDFAPQ